MNERIVYGCLIKRKIKDVKYLEVFSTKNLEVVIKCPLDSLFCTLMALILSAKGRNFEYSTKLISLLQREIIRVSLAMSSIKSVSCIHSTYKVVK